MREIRFRYVWKRKEDGHLWIEDVPVECLEGRGDSVFVQGDHNLWELIGRNQYIGLKDNNGKEIYEGDVVKWGDHCEWCRENPVRIATVRIDPDIIFDSQVGVFPFGAFSYQDTHEHLEVVGNLYETPDLIPKQERE